MALSASIGKKFQPFTGNGDVSKWVRHSRVGQKTTNEQTLKSGKGQINWIMISKDLMTLKLLIPEKGGGGGKEEFWNNPNKLIKIYISD